MKMLNTLSFSYTASLDLLYDVDGHRHIDVPLFFEKEHFTNDFVDFVLDTGAYLTVLTQRTARLFEYDKLKPVRTNIPLNGFADSHCKGDLVEIPGMLIGGRILEDVRVAIPYIATEDDILGLNVLEHFNYLIDSANDRIYFADNAVYKAPRELGCGKIHEIAK